MRKVQYICDRCGAILGRQAVMVIPNIVELETGDIVQPLKEATLEMHFCPKCTDNILKAMEPLREEEPEPEQPKPGGDAPKRRQRLDAGRVMALHRAGWDNAKIADDIRATEEQVRQCIYYQENKKGKTPERGGKEKA